MLELDELLSGFDGDVTDEETEARIDALFDMVSENKEEFAAKVDSYIYLMAEMEARAEIRKAEAKRLSEIAKRDSGNAEKLSGRLFAVLKRLGMSELRTKLHELKIANAGGVLAVDVDLSDYTFDRKSDPMKKQIPKKYVKVTYGIDNEAVRADLDLGKCVPFARFGERKERLRIK